MKAFQREIIGGIVTVLVTMLIVWFYFGTIEEEQTTVRADLYSLVAPDPEALLAVNRPDILNKVILKNQSIHETFSEYIPAIYLSILQKTPEMPPALFSFHPQGVVMYVQSDGSLDFIIEKEVLEPMLGIYNPQTITKDGITFTYYPETENRFFGFYQHKGAFVASFSKKLLEEVARQQIKNKRTLPDKLDKVRKLADRNVPLNLFVPADRLDLYVNINDTLQWQIYDKWLLADIFCGEGNICLFGTQPYFASMDTLYAPMADTLTKRIEAFFPKLRITSEIKHDETMVYYTGCN